MQAIVIHYLQYNLAASAVVQIAAVSMGHLACYASSEAERQRVLTILLTDTSRKIFSEIW